MTENPLLLQFVDRWAVISRMDLVDVQRWPEEEHKALSPFAVKRLNTYVGGFVYGALLYSRCSIHEIADLLGFAPFKLLGKLGLFMGYASKARYAYDNGSEVYLLIKESGVLYDKTNRLLGILTPGESVPDRPTEGERRSEPSHDSERRLRRSDPRSEESASPW